MEALVAVAAAAAAVGGIGGGSLSTVAINRIPVILTIWVLPNDKIDRAQHITGTDYFHT